MEHKVVSCGAHSLTAGILIPQQFRHVVAQLCDVDPLTAALLQVQNIRKEPRVLPPVTMAKEEQVLAAVQNILVSSAYDLHPA